MFKFISLYQKSNTLPIFMFICILIPFFCELSYISNFPFCRGSQWTTTLSMCKKMVFVSFWFWYFPFRAMKVHYFYSLFWQHTLGYLDISCSTKSLGSFFHIPLNSYIVDVTRNKTLGLHSHPNIWQKGKKRSSSESFYT